MTRPDHIDLPNSSDQYTASRPGGDDIGIQIRELVERCGDDIQSDAAMAERVDETLENMERILTSYGGDGRYLKFTTEPGDLIAVVSDLHGDYAALETILHELYPPEITNAEASRRRLVILGDILDRGPRDFQLLHLVTCLARVLGDRLILMRGNHEELRADDGELLSAVRSDETYFVVKYGTRIGADRAEYLERFFACLPHFVVLEHPEGRIGFVHAGIPPEFLEQRCDSPIRYMEVENIVRSFIWGRPAPPGKTRPKRSYPFDTFYPEDVEHFCKRNGLAMIIRGHDTEQRGYGVMAGGKVITISSSGAGQQGGGESAYAAQVGLPRYLLLEHDALFRSEVSEGEHKGLDAGIGVKEVHARDILLIVEDRGVDATTVEQLMLAGQSVGLQLSATVGWPLHLVRRSRLEMTGLAAREIVGEEVGFSDRTLDPSPQLRMNYSLVERDGTVELIRTTSDGEPVSGTPTVVQPSLEQFAMLCVRRIAADAEIDVPNPNPGTEETL